MRRLRLAAALVIAVCGAGIAGTAVSASAKPTTTTANSAVTATKTVTRDNLVNGQDDVVDKRTVTLKVSQTKLLRGRQGIDVSWTGAHPTGGIVSDQNSDDAQREEYPFVLLECRGVDSTTVKPSQQLSPSTCWTQSWDEHFQSTSQTDFPPYRLDRYASLTDRGAIADQPSPLPAACASYHAYVEHWIPFVAASGKTYDGGTQGCGGEPPESESAGSSALPSNETFGVTGTNGKGGAKFDVWTAAENASLGCSSSVPCSLVAVPIEGISCDPTAASLPAIDQPKPTDTKDPATCETDGLYAPGQLLPSSTTNPLTDLSVTGSLWWSASNWRNRITVPLTFQVAADACDVVSSSNDVLVYGSEVLGQATSQWSPHFCLNSKLFKLTHVQTGEPQSRTLLASGSAEAAFTSDAPSDGYGKPVVNAPVAVSGFAISYVIDGANGQPYTKLKLDPRLLAKLLTESYPSILPVKEEDSQLANNPLNITLDPEFQKLNPGITDGVATQAASTLLALSSNSDVIEALTTYINDNPEARAWLNGKPDPWGMTVNPAYADIKLPVNNWPLLSSFQPKTYYASNLNPCLHDSPVPYLPLVAAPLSTLQEIGEAMQFSEPQSTTICNQIDGTTLGEKLITAPRQTTGYRFMLGITTLADADRYQLNQAALQTTSASKFVTPSNASLRAATDLLKPDTTTGTWPVNYQTLRTAKAAAGAYPGTMVVYTAVPTSGLPAEDAKDYSEFLKFAVTDGQTPGNGVGQLPDGYLPMTKANGLQDLGNYTLAAADAVAAQKGKLPSLTDPNPTPTSTPTPTPTPTTSTATPAPSDTSSVPSVTPPASPATSPAPVSTPSVANPPAAVVAALGKTLGIAMSGGVAVIVLIGLALVGGLGVPTTYYIGRKRGRW